jgi:hypothetical protein
VKIGPAYEKANRHRVILTKSCLQHIDLIQHRIEHLIDASGVLTCLRKCRLTYWMLNGNPEVVYMFIASRSNETSLATT